MSRATRRGALIVAALLLVAGCSSGGHPAPAHTAPATIAVHGTLTLTDPQSTFQALVTGTHVCAGVGGYSDITPGAEVVVSDDAGHTLAITQLGPGRTPTVKHGLPHDCDFTFATRVPAGKRFYGVQVTHRGVVKYPESDIASPHLQIGS